jgi:hypothetical protein
MTGTDNTLRASCEEVGAKPIFSDSEVITLMLAMDFLAFESETQSLSFMRANYHELFPRLCDQSRLCHGRCDIETPFSVWVAGAGRM